MKNKHLYNVVLAALFTALCCVSTMIMIPLAGMGYVHTGDTFVLISGWILGPVYGTFAAALGSALSDLFLGYATYVPGTFVIKALVALCAWGIFKAMSKLNINKVVSRTVSAVIAELVMVLGYFLYAALVFGEGFAAIATVPPNLLQGLFGVVVGVILVEVIQKLLSKIRKDTI